VTNTGSIRVEITNWDEGGQTIGGWLRRLLPGWAFPWKRKPAGEKQSRGRGRPELDDQTRKRMVREYADYKASGLTQREYLRSRGNFLDMNTDESLAYLDRCRKQWEKENPGK
jgi:hypothetical protein